MECIPVSLACSVGVFTGNVCWCWRLGHWGELGEERWEEKIFVTHWVREEREMAERWLCGAGWPVACCLTAPFLSALAFSILSKTRDAAETCPSLQDCDGTPTFSEAPCLVLGHVWSSGAWCNGMLVRHLRLRVWLLLPFPLEHTFWQRWSDSF